ncbi:lasso peptide biosynthesis B2 protein [Streptomyces sp. MP131-18]|uniref:lasso peptide biosynthesis B2 protein n=1 Tax=Streptomyces sp. MP131-18 TaxID=1857892 RepID=UPI00097BCA35|nr:lasso peptide biosynthesis B2 protein [Streptomyces sp. MP131-18]ONK13224.1 hypothetical protein STBA_39870 [Streptomyces sp. MP131-18]
MSDLPTNLTCPTHVRAIDFRHVLVLVDYRTGRVQCLLPAAAAQWTRAARTGTSDGMTPALLQRLLHTGMLTPTSTATPWPTPADAAPTARRSAGTEYLAGASRPPRAPLRASAAAATALAAVFALKHAGDAALAMQRVTTALMAAAVTGEHAATGEQIHAAVLAVRRVGWFSPGRTACLEESAAATLLLASRRLSATWCHGVAPDPVRLHAWVQTADGDPVAEPPTTRAYTPVLTIGGTHHHQP